MSDSEQPKGRDFSEGVPLADLADQAMALGHLGEDAILLVKRGKDVFAVGATCTHYNGPLNEGLLVGNTVRCPWHHACFSLKTGEALRAPALNPLPRWRTEIAGDRVFIRERLEEAKPPQDAAIPDKLKSIIIVGGGAAGYVAAQTLRQEGYTGALTILSADSDPPCDRPNLSKDYLAGNAQEDWIPLRPADFYTTHNIGLRLKTRAKSIDAKNRKVVLENGETLAYDALLLATGAEPVKLDIPGADHAHVHYLRTLADSKSIIAAAEKAKRAVVIGASFIGLEVAASLRTRGLEVHVIGPQTRPLERVLGRELGDIGKAVHQENGVVFHLGTSATRIDKDAVELKSGERLPADLVVAGIGVKPEITLAQSAGATADNGVTVDAYLETNVPGIFAAGDIARWPDPHSGANIRVEHWVVAERQGLTAARNMIGERIAFDAVPFFWSQHYDTTISYVGHAENWDRIDIDGDPKKRDCKATYVKDGKTLAVATVSRDLESLKAERDLENAGVP